MVTTLRKKVVPPLYPLRNETGIFNADPNNYGEWVNRVTIVNDPAKADIMLPAYYLEHYRANGLTQALKQYHQQALNANIIPVYFSSGDLSLTPPLNEFHLYVHGDYRSANHINYALYPNFFPDPLNKFYDGAIRYHLTKTELPVCGFCGQANAGIEKKYLDYLRVLNKKIGQLFNPWSEDPPPFLSAAYNRAKILEALQQSKKLTCNFIIEKKYRGGAIDPADKHISSQRYFENIQQSLYIICYRGTGNFSVRFYETLAAGRIPVIIRSDDVLPLADQVNWSVFPMVREDMILHADDVIAAFHAAQSAETLLQLQQHARKLYEDYFTYKGFMQVFVNKYMREAAPR